MREVKFCGHLEKLQTKKPLKFHLELNFYNFFIIGIDTIGFCVNIIRNLVFSIVLLFFLLHILLEGEY